MLTYKYEVGLTASDGSKVFEERDFQYGPGKVEFFEMALRYPVEGVYTTWLSFQYRVPGVAGISTYLSTKKSRSLCILRYIMQPR